MDVQTAMVVAATSVSQQLAVVKNVYALQVSVYKQMEWLVDQVGINYCLNELCQT